jgi:hypothetical protein
MSWLHAATKKWIENSVQREFYSTTTERCHLVFAYLSLLRNFSIDKVNVKLDSVGFKALKRGPPKPKGLQRARAFDFERL